MAEEMLKAAQGKPASGTGRRYEPAARAPAPPRAKQSSLGADLARGVVKQLSTREGQRLVRGILGGLFKAR